MQGAVPKCRVQRPAGAGPVSRQLNRHYAIDPVRRVPEPAREANDSTIQASQINTLHHLSLNESRLCILHPGSTLTNQYVRRQSAGEISSL